MSRTDTGAEAVNAQAQPSPDFEQTVRVILTIFAVFTGFAIGKAVEAVAGRIAIPPGDASLGFPPDALVVFAGRVAGDSYFWALIALLALMLRFLIGSAIHLNDTYVKKVGEPEARVSQFFSFLFKDLIFLVAFGIVALLIAKTVTIDKSADPKAPFEVREFAFGAMLFLLCGLLWSAFDIAIRWLARNKPAHEWPGIGAYKIWPALDASQLGLTWLYIWWAAPTWWGHDERTQLMWLALLYVGYLFLDVSSLIWGLQKRAAAAKIAAERAAPRIFEFEVTQELIDAGGGLLDEAHERRVIVLDKDRRRGTIVLSETDVPIHSRLAYDLIDAILQRARRNDIPA
jgi:hypothetical protein